MKGPLCWLAAAAIASRNAASLARSTVASVDVVTVTNTDYAMGVAAIINASRVHSTAHIRVFVGFDGDPQIFYDYLDCVRLDATDVIVRRPYELIDKQDIPVARAVRGQDASRLSTPANYARFTLPKTFPEIKIAWYIDSDALPLADLAGPEYTRFSRSGAIMQAVQRLGSVGPEFNKAVLPLYQERYGQPFSLSAPSWNAGVWLTNMSQWDTRGIAEDARYWVTKSNEFSLQGKGALWKLNTQPIMYLIFHESVKTRSQLLPSNWNCESYKLSYSDSVPTQCKVVHWNGRHKPWQAATKGHLLWKVYLPRHQKKLCSGILSGNKNYSRRRGNSISALDAPTVPQIVPSATPYPDPLPGSDEEFEAAQDNYISVLNESLDSVVGDDTNGEISPETDGDVSGAVLF